MRECMVKYRTQYPEREVFFRLRENTISEIRAVFDWAVKRALLSEVSFLDGNSLGRNKTTEVSIDELLKHIDRESKGYFRIIFRKNLNWFMRLTDKKHIEDLIEIGIRSIDIGKREYFIRCYLNKKWLNQLLKKFPIDRIGNSC